MPLLRRIHDGRMEQEVRKHFREFCEGCESFEALANGEDTLQMYSFCCRNETAFPTFSFKENSDEAYNELIQKFEETEVPKACPYYVEQCMEEWYGDKKKD